MAASSLKEQLGVPQAQVPGQDQGNDLVEPSPLPSSTPELLIGSHKEKKRSLDASDFNTDEQEDGESSEADDSPIARSDSEVNPEKKAVLVKKKRKIGGRSEESLAVEKTHGADDPDAGSKKQLKRRSQPKETTAQKKNRLGIEYRDQRVKERVKGKKPALLARPRDVIFETINRHSANKNAAYANALKELCTELPTESQTSRLQQVSVLGPNFLGRTASRTSGYRFLEAKNKTNGYTTNNVMLPAADINKEEELHDSILSLPQGATLYMLGTHLIWLDMRSDEFLSTSKDFCFLIIHALDRYNEGQGRVTIQFFYRRKTKDRRGNSAVFYPALDFCEIFEVQKWSGWRNHAKIGLHPRKFTQEFLSHGPVVLDTAVMRQAKIEDLIRDGLYELYPFLAIPNDHERVGLYAGQVEARKAGFPPNTIPVPRKGSVYTYASRTVPLTLQMLETNRRMTMNFMRVPEGVDENTLEPHLHIFLGFLTLQKRERRDTVLMEWISKRYQASDVECLYLGSSGAVCPGFTTLANNLPSYMQYLDLIRDCISLLSIPVELPENVVEEAHVYHNYRGRDYRYAACDNKYNRKDEKSKPFDHDGVVDKRETARVSRKAKADNASLGNKLLGTEITNGVPSTAEILLGARKTRALRAEEAPDRVDDTPVVKSRDEAHSQVRSSVSEEALDVVMA